MCQKSGWVREHSPVEHRMKQESYQEVIQLMTTASFLLSKQEVIQLMTTACFLLSKQF